MSHDDIDARLDRLATQPFRARFQLRGRDRAIAELRGPQFVAQHATATCCRTCLSKWHDIAAGVALTEQQQTYVVDVICRWIGRQMSSTYLS